MIILGGGRAGRFFDGAVALVVAQYLHRFMEIGIAISEAAVDIEMK